MSEHYPRIRRSGVFDTGPLPRIREDMRRWQRRFLD